MTAAPARPAPETLPEMESMILRLGQLSRAEPSKERRADYTAAIDRLHALAYRLERDAAPGRTIGLPGGPGLRQKAERPSPAPSPAAPAPQPVAKARQPTLPLGPVIVRARKRQPVLPDP